MGTLSVLSQPEAFVSRVVPSLFHSTPDDFIRFLERDGNKFLRFYWEQASHDQQVGGRASALGLNYDIRRPFDQTTVALITLPRPAAGPGTYFIAAIYRPTRRTPFLGIADTTKVVSLEVRQTPEGAAVTTLIDWSRKLAPEALGPGPVPRLDDFYRAVCELIKP
jgi:hypothetical protein